MCRCQYLLCRNISGSTRYDCVFNFEVSSRSSYAGNRKYATEGWGLQRSLARLHHRNELASKSEGEGTVMETSGLKQQELSEASGRGDRKFVWLKRAFIVQTVLLILIIFAMIFVSWRFSVQQRTWMNANIEKQRELDQKQKDLQRLANSLGAAQFDAAITAKRMGDYATADRMIENALQAFPGDPFSWRQRALISIHLNRAEQTLNDIQKAPINKNDGRNLLTEAILYCALQQPAKAMELKSQALQSFTPAPQDREDYQSVCHTSL
jgi:tetratricopeptide (TPR) repeat protein